MVVKLTEEYQESGSMRVRTDPKGSRKVYDYIGKLLKEFGVRILDKDYSEPTRALYTRADPRAPFETVAEPNAFYEIEFEDEDDDNIVIDIFGWTTPDDVEFEDRFAVTYDDRFSRIYPEFQDKLQAFVDREGLEDWDVISF